ncbi:UNVERIFIED_CONTAM: hypothetical protein Slati_2528900 [Sesamum latifolium]|uniref:Reverse transcriptase domain-containing protein n=1 Tax=Sesamum latifolium TaxID=2727402 RepID=A0AAW2WHA4_9LAMI
MVSPQPSITCWDIIAEDIIEVARDFFIGTPIPRSFTTTSITLIPKDESPQSWSDFRPISLCNVTNKIISKLLYNKIAQALPNLISPSQSGFFPDDFIIFSRSIEEALTKLMHFLDHYEEQSGQQINHSKSYSIPPGKNANLLAHRIKTITGFTMKTLSITYLGAPLYKGNKKEVLYEPLLDKIRSKISGWEQSYLSQGGRL